MSMFEHSHLSLVYVNLGGMQTDASERGTPEQQLLLTPEQAANRLALSRTRVYQLISTGELPSLKIGRARRIVAADLGAWVSNQLEALDG